MSTTTYDKTPTIRYSGRSDGVARGWDAVVARIVDTARRATQRGRAVVAIDCYPGVDTAEICRAFEERIDGVQIIETDAAMKPPAEIDAMVQPDLTDDPVFGRITARRAAELFDENAVQRCRDVMAASTGSMVIVLGFGATLIASNPSACVLADLTRWEGQLRFRAGRASNLGVHNTDERWQLQYKRAYFVDWRIADDHKFEMFGRCDAVLDTEIAGDPKLVAAHELREALRHATERPFRVVPYFDPAPWGGQWMRRVCGLPEEPPNFGWSFDGVPEENALRFEIGCEVFTTPAMNLIRTEPERLLGPGIVRWLGAEYPIRFDFLDTVGGGNLSLQVHPLAEYMRRNFGLSYTQEESYYLLDAEPGACVYLGLREGVDPEAMLAELREAQRGGAPFDADRHVARWPAKKHDHFLIPPGTVHCSGAGAMVLEISATPYIFTFKLWDWGRLGLDGRPRPIHLEHGERNVCWDRTESWTRDQVVNRVTTTARGDGWVEERTGLHETQFLETRRYWFSRDVPLDTAGTVNQLNLVEGESVEVISPDGAFDAFEVRYAETFIVPAAVGPYVLRPGRTSRGRLGVVRAFCRPIDDCG